MHSSRFIFVPSLFLSASSNEARASRDHFFFLQTFMNCGMATKTVSLLQKLSGNGLR